MSLVVILHLWATSPKIFLSPKHCDSIIEDFSGEISLTFSLQSLYLFSILKLWLFPLENYNASLFSFTTSFCLQGCIISIFSAARIIKNINCLLFSWRSAIFLKTSTVFFELPSEGILFYL